MITILTNDECIQFNLKDYNRERAFCSTLNCHKTNQTGKKLLVKSPQFQGGERLINPDDVTHISQENRQYHIEDGKAIDNLIKEC